MMGQFVGIVKLTPNGDGRTWTVDEAFSYIAENGDRVDVPAFFVTDLASVPRALWPFWPPFGRYSDAAIVHDRAYTVQSFSRSRCDDILYESMADLGVDWWTRHCIWWGVRSGGWLAWGQHARKNKEALNAKTVVAE